LGVIRDRVRSGLACARAKDTMWKTRGLLLAGGQSQREIAAQLGVSRGAVYRVCAETKAVLSRLLPGLLSADTDQRSQLPADISSALPEAAAPGLPARPPDQVPSKQRLIGVYWPFSSARTTTRRDAVLLRSRAQPVVLPHLGERQPSSR
jgi:hypothetical protein